MDGNSSARSMLAVVNPFLAITVPVVVAAPQKPSLSTQRLPLWIETLAIVLPSPIEIQFFELEASCPLPANRPVEVAPKKLMVEVAPLPEIDITGPFPTKVEVEIDQEFGAFKIVEVALTG